MSTSTGSAASGPLRRTRLRLAGLTSAETMLQAFSGTWIRGSVMPG